MARKTHSVLIAELQKEVAALNKTIAIMSAQMETEREARIAGEASFTKRITLTEQAVAAATKRVTIQD